MEVYNNSKSIYSTNVPKSKIKSIKIFAYILS